MLNHQIEQLRAMIEGAQRIVVFTGAGISTESGIPDYRSPGTGTWEKMKPIYFQEFLASPEARREAWRRRFESDATMRAAEPNRGHRAVARLVREGRVRDVITQNIDGLHQASGVPEAQVIELHGNTTYATCLSCGLRHEIADIHAAFAQTDAVPDCRRCGGLLKTATVSFGQAMPQGPMLRARQAVLAADLCLVLGSSLVVYPAAGFPEMAKRNGAGLVILNRQETGLDDIADLVIHEGIGDVLGGAVGVN